MNEGWRTTVFRRGFIRLLPQMDARGGFDHRAELARPVGGLVVDVGAGTGAMFGHYTSAVTRLVAVEPDPALRALAARAAEDAQIDLDVVDGTAERLPVPTGSVDWVVCSLVLCSVGDQQAALAEFRRVLKPGGALAYYEHIRSARRLPAALEDLVAVPWSAVAGGCHPNRDTPTSIAAAGLEPETTKRFRFSRHRGVPPVAHVLGVARPTLTPAGSPIPGSVEPSS